MGYVALYRQWRPLVFADVVEQEHVVQTLKNSVKTARIAHAYLFCGTRGTGKTTVAHILSRAINCLNPQDGDPCNRCDICKGILSGTILDVMEIDAASNNSVDNVREIRDDVIYAPSKAKYKVYIVDEVHMLSSGAFNALLKTLEEPPAHVVFILATTEPHKLPATILSRCQRFDFRRISVESIAERLSRIASSNGVALTGDALRLIARSAEGALRDAISLLDQCISTGKQEIGYADVMSVIGMVNEPFMAETVDSVCARDAVRVLELVDSMVISGKDIARFVSDLVYYYRNLLICKVAGKPEEIIEISPEMMETMKKQSSSMSREEITFVIRELSSLISGLKWAANPRILLEVTLIKLCEADYTASREDMQERLSYLEKKIALLESTPRPAAPVQTEQQTEQVRPGKVMNPGDTSVTRQTPHIGQPVGGNPVDASSENKKDAMPEIECWDKILNDLKNSGRRALHTYLFGTKAVWLDQHVAGIVFGKDNGFNRTMVSKVENLQILEEAIRKHLDLTEIRVKCISEDDVAVPTDKKTPEMADELVEKAKSLADMLGAPLKILEE